MKYADLANGLRMPSIGLGTFPMTGVLLSDVVKSAYQAGFRLFDTADNYYNEADLGDSLQLLYNNYGAKRDQLFLVSKVSDELYHPQSIGGAANKGKYFWKSSPYMQSPNAVHNIIRKKIEDSLHNLHTDYLDLYLMHWPYPDFFFEIWYEMEQLYREGLVRSIGVCNCSVRHLQKLESCDISPMINQIETSPINTKTVIIDYCKQKGIKVMVYSPLMSLRRKEMLSYQQCLDRLAKKHSRNKAQILLRFDVQRGLVPIPKSSNPNRLAANISIFDFKLSKEDMQELYSCNINYQYLPESKSCPGL